MIPSNGKWTTLANKCDDNPMVTITNGEKSDILKGDVESPSRQVLPSNPTETDHDDKQGSNEPLVNTVEDIVAMSKGKGKRGCGC
jgi:hypothetical protein